MSESPLILKWQDLLQQKLLQALADARISNQLEDFNQAYLNFLAQETPPATLFSPQAVRQGDWPVIDPYAANFQNSQEVIKLLFRWLKGLGDTELSLHNYLLSQYLGLKTQIQRLAGTMADLELFQRDTAGGVFLFGDNFSSADRVDTTTVRDLPTISLDRELQAVTLPPASTVNTPQPISVKLNPLSNGVSGNNQQLGIVQPCNDLLAMIDGNLGSWYEYELVSTGVVSQPLLLDFTINYAQQTLLNRLRLYLNNLGSTIWPRLQDIQVSLDGKNFVSLKDEIKDLSPAVDPFEIDPQATQNGGLLIFCFQPHLVRHLRLIIQQSGYYFIDTSAGSRYRYAIGIREVLGLGLNYQATGEFISKPYDFSRPVSRVMLDTQQAYMATSDICQLRHFLSPDRGESWQELQPVKGLSAALPKVLTFEDQDISSLTYRALLNRQDTLAAQQSLSQAASELVEYLSLPSAPPFLLNLSQTPLDNTLSLCLPYAGSTGLEAKLFLGISDGAPMQFFQASFALQGNEEVWVNKQRWQRLDNLQDAAAGDLVYAVNYATQTISFGDGVKGKIPPAGFQIFLRLPAERLLLQNSEAITCTLQYPVMQDKQNLTIYRVDAPQMVNRELLARGATLIRLGHHPLVENQLLTFSSDSLAVFGQQQTYLDGSSELSKPGDYSVDYLLGIIHTFTPTPVNSNCYLSYQYIPRLALAKTDWNFLSSTEVELNPDAFKSQEVVGEDLSNQAGCYVVSLANASIVRGSLTFQGEGAPTQELEFIDGLLEFTGVTLQKDESVPVGEQAFTLLHVPRQDYQVLFSDTVVFAQEVSSLSQVRTPGSYYLNYDTGEVHTYLSTTGGQVNYYYHHDLNTLEGSYSVDYAAGRLHLFEPLAAHIKVSYQFCHYEAEYYIAESIPAEVYEISPADKQIRFTNLAYLRQLTERLQNDKVLAVSYSYLSQEAANTGALQMLTPILHGYTLRALFKENGS